MNNIFTLQNLLMVKHCSQLKKKGFRSKLKTLSIHKCIYKNQQNVSSASQTHQFISRKMVIHILIHHFNTYSIQLHFTCYSWVTMLV